LKGLGKIFLIGRSEDETRHDQEQIYDYRRYSTKDKTNFLRVARGSVYECVAILDLLPYLKIQHLELTSHYQLLETIGRMISGLIGWLEKNLKGLIHN
jgi:hypothetical protein